MTRSQAIKDASIVPIGGCEDQAKMDVLRLFKKSNDIDYRKLDQDYIYNKNLQYEDDQKRYNYLVNKMFDTPLNDEELCELDYLSDNIGSYTDTFYITRIIDHSSVLIKLFFEDKIIKKIRSLKISIIAILSVIYCYNDKCIKIDLKQAYLCIYVNLCRHIKYINGDYFIHNTSPP